MDYAKNHEEVRVKDIIREFFHDKVLRETEFSNYKLLIKEEVEVREKIQEKLMAISYEKHNEIKKLKLILKTPRLYSIYCKENNINQTFLTQTN